MEKIEINGKIYILDADKAIESGIMTEKKQNPKSWQEYMENVDMNANATSFKGSKEEILLSMFKTQEEAKAFRALNKLIILRDIWNDGWIPDYTNVEFDGLGYGCIIRNCKNKPELIMSNSRPSILTFETPDVAEEFLNTYMDLIKEAIMFL